VVVLVFYDSYIIVAQKKRITRAVYENPKGWVVTGDEDEATIFNKKTAKRFLKIAQKKLGMLPELRCHEAILKEKSFVGFARDFSDEEEDDEESERSLSELVSVETSEGWELSSEIFDFIETLPDEKRKEALEMFKAFASFQNERFGL
jgi:hypothetical protein